MAEFDGKMIAGCGKNVSGEHCYHQVDSYSSSVEIFDSFVCCWCGLSHAVRYELVRSTAHGGFVPVYEKRRIPTEKPT